MGWEGIITAAAHLMALAERLMDIVKGMGVTQKEIDAVVEANREERRKALESARDAEWPT